MKDVVAEFRLFSVNDAEDKAVIIVPRSKGYAVRCINYRSKNAPMSLRKDYSNYTYTLVDGPLSACWFQFLFEVEYLGGVYGLQ